jgi:4,5-DOPA dioxygenase extradiol
MTTQIPSLFVSHGSPMLALDGSPAHHFLKALPETLPTPMNILLISAHWETAAPSVSVAPRPETIHDFGGFSPKLHAMQYPAPGAPALAERAAALLEETGFDVMRNSARGLDHGAWIPLRLVYPNADIPVTQLSIQPGLSPRHHLELGQALRPLRDEGTLIMASGAITHNLGEFFRNRYDLDDEAPGWVREFAEWIGSAIADGRIDDLLNYRVLAPFAERNHPTEEHLLPLFVALGAGSDVFSSERLHASFSYGILAMDAYMLH